MPLKALFLVSIISNPRSIFIFKCTDLKVVYRITLIVLVIGKAQFRRAMLSWDSSCCICKKQVFTSHGAAQLIHVYTIQHHYMVSEEKNILLIFFVASLEKKRSNLEELIKQLKEQHKDYISNLETEQEQSMNEQKTTLTNEKNQVVQQGNILGPFLFE